MPQYPTPQFIEEEGKIISFLTFKQFFWLVGGIAAVIIFFYILPFALFMILSAVTMGLVSMIAFVKIGNSSIIAFLADFIGFLTKNKTYTWSKKGATYSLKPAAPEAPTVEAVQKPRPMMQESALKQIKKTIETKK